MNYIDNTAKSSYRGLNLLGLISCMGALLLATLYIQQHLGFAPCSLCMVSRMVVLTLGVLFFLAWVQNPRQFGQRCYAVLRSLFTSIGIGINLYHIWLQNLATGQTSECEQALELVSQQPLLQELLRPLLQSSADCAETYWTLAGITLPQLTLLLFLVLFAIDITQLRKKRRSYFK